MHAAGPRHLSRSRLTTTGLLLAVGAAALVAWSPSAAGGRTVLALLPAPPATQLDDAALLLDLRRLDAEDIHLEDGDGARAVGPAVATLYGQALVRVPDAPDWPYGPLAGAAPLGDIGGGEVADGASAVRSRVSGDTGWADGGPGCQERADVR